MGVNGQKKQKRHSPFQHADVLVRDETLNPANFASPPITGRLAVEGYKISLLEW